MEQREAGQEQKSGALYLAPSEETLYVPAAKPSPSQAADDHQNVFYVRDNDAPLEDEEEDVFGSAPPFQFSETLYPIKETEQRRTGQSAQSPSPLGEAPTVAPFVARPAVRRFFTRRMIMPTAIVVMLLLAGTLTVFAQSTPSSVRTPSTPTVLATKQTGSKAASATSHSTQGGKPKTVSSPSASTQSQSGTVLPQLPAGWTNANLTMGDALFAERTATTFTDREMSLDYRSIGTRAVHAGTFTAATFILTANAQRRFQQNDIRVINNTLFDTVQQEQRIQSVVAPQAQIVNFATQGQQQFAWVDVSFFLWQSRLVNGQRIEGIVPDPATGQPHLYHMTALLLRVPQNEQGNTPAMGGTGWLVSTYGLDLPPNNALQIAQPA